MIIFGVGAPWVASANLMFNARGQWLAALGCALTGGAMAALALDVALRWRVTSSQVDSSERGE